MVCATIGGIFLYKSYAYYEEDKEYNVIKGIIPDFGHDIKLSFTIDGQENNTTAFPNKDSNYVGSSVTCKDNVTAEWDNVNWGLKNIVANNNKKVNCNVAFKTKTILKDKVKQGDYVSMTPSLTSFTIPKSLTGNITDQTINPSELDIWRVLNKNEDGTIDLISEYTSSNTITLYGEIGYRYAVGTLNLIAQAYENANYTINSRAPGYKEQTEFVDSTISHTTSGEYSTRDEGKATTEEIGGGDSLYKNDYDLINSVINTRSAKVKNSNENGVYWLASRGYVVREGPNHGEEYLWDIRGIDGNGDLISYTVFFNDNYSNDKQAHFRPIVTLKAEVNALGSGTKQEPWILS